MAPFVYVQIFFFISLMATILQQKIPKEGISCNKTLTNVSPCRAGFAWI